MCFKKRKIPACIVLWLSVAAIICAAVIIFFAAKLTNSDALKEFGNIDNIKKNVDFDNARSVIFRALVIFAVMIILTSLCGVLTYCIKARPFACLYGCCLLPTWIAVIVLGAIAVVVNNVGKTKLIEECDKVVLELEKTNNQGTVAGAGANVGLQGCDAETFQEDIKITLEIYELMMGDKEMCSANCKCKASDKSTEWTNTDITTLPKRCRSWDFSGDIETYEECLTKAAEAANQKGTNLSTPFETFAKNLSEQDDWNTLKDFISFFERSYKCAGVCQPAMFYLSKSIDEGKPTGSCIGNLKDAISESFGGLGAATLISGFLLLAIFICQYCLWYKY